MSVRKAVIPAAGLGTRFLPATKSTPKEMLPLVDKPTIQYVVEEAVRAGIEDIIFISGRTKKTLEDHFDRAPELEYELAQKGKTEALEEVRRIAELAKFHFVRQGEPLGLGHAVATARHHIGDESFAVLLGDDVIHERVPLLERMIAAHDEKGRSVVAVMEVEDPSLYGCAVGEPAGESLIRLREVVEKPPRDEAKSNLAVMGRYVFTPDIFDALDRIKPGAGGELQLTDAFALLAAESEVYGYVFSEGRYDAGQKLDYLRAMVELACERDDLGPAFKAYLIDFVRGL